MKRIEPGPTLARAVISGNQIYFCGHGAKGADITEQAQNLLKRYEELFELNGTDKDHIIFATIFISDMKAKPKFNEVWNKWVNPGCTPARVCVEAGLEEGCLVEICMTCELK